MQESLQKMSENSYTCNGGTLQLETNGLLTVPGSGKWKLGSNAFASHLYRSSSFNSSGRSSNCDNTDDMYSDVSLEEDVQDLNHKVHMLQKQVNVLTDSVNSTDDRYVRVKADNAALQARINILDEQLKEEQLRAEDRLQNEQRRQREIMVRVEREKQLQLENASIRMKTLDLENISLREELARERALVKTLKEEKNEAVQKVMELNMNLKDLSDELHNFKDIERRQDLQLKTAEQLIEDLTKEVEHLRSEKKKPVQSSNSPEMIRLEELQAKLEFLHNENQNLKSVNEELQEIMLTRSVEEGKSLLVETEDSLAAEFKAMSQEQMQKALKEQQDVNTHLRLYIDGILLNIVENYPQLLEVKQISS